MRRQKCHKAVIEVLQGEKTASQIAGELEVHPIMLSQWKNHFLENGSDIFKQSRKKKYSSHEHVDETVLFEQIGRLKVENEWYKKNWGAALKDILVPIETLATVGTKDDILGALALFQKTDKDTLLVVENGYLVGLLIAGDLSRIIFLQA